MKPAPFKMLGPAILHLRDAEGNYLPPHVTIGGDGALFHNIGMLIAQWSAFEKEFGTLLEVLIEHNKSSNTEWKALRFKQKKALMRDEWETFAGHHDHLKSYLPDLMADVDTAHALRNLLAHGIMEFSVLDIKRSGESCIRFLDEKTINKRTRPYSSLDFQKCIASLRRNAGKLMWISYYPTFPSDFPSCCRSILQLLPSRKHLTVTMQPIA